MKKNHKLGIGIIGILLIILVVVMIVLFYNKKDCDSDFSLMMIDKSAIPEINGYSFEIKNDSITIDFKRNSLIEFTIGNFNSDYYNTSFRKVDLSSIFLPKWTFKKYNSTGVIAYNLFGFLNKYVLRLDQKIYQTESFFKEATPIEIKIKNESTTIGYFKKLISIPTSYRLCIKKSLTAYDNVLLSAMVISFDIGK